MQKQLYKSSSNRMVAGVAGGIGEYFDIDPTLVRIAFILFGLAGGPGLLLYGVLWVIIPERPTTEEKVKNTFDA
jgi:phage shock protein PspC (stress-responsive transcriptional regulator)